MKKRIFKIALLFLCFAVMLVSFAFLCKAHSGRTDSRGGHKDNKNVSGLGSYHYHCGGYPAHLHTSGYCPYTDVFPTGVDFVIGKTEIFVGERIDLIANVYPSNSCNTKVTYKSSDSGVVSIEGNTLVAKGVGSAVISATTFNGKEYNVNVSIKEVAVESITIDAPKSLEVGENALLKVKFVPTNATNKKIIWHSSNDEIVTVDSVGYIKAVGVGTAEIIAENISLTATVKIEILPKETANDKDVNFTVSENTDNEEKHYLTDKNKSVDTLENTDDEIESDSSSAFAGFLLVAGVCVCVVLVKNKNKKAKK